MLGKGGRARRRLPGQFLPDHLCAGDTMEMKVEAFQARIVVLDGYTLNPGDNPWDDVSALGDLRIYDRSSEAEILQRAMQAEIVLTNKTPLSARSIEAMDKLRFVSVMATGYDVVDVKAARRREIPVSNVPEYGTESVAQFVFALLLELASGVGQHDRAARDGRWAASGSFSLSVQRLVELAGKTMGIVGFGRIGRRVGEIAHAFGMRVTAFDRSPERAPEYRPFAWASSVEELFRTSDVVSLNCSLNPANARFVNGSLLARAKPTAFLVNAARGGLVHEADLAAALNAGRLAGAALDVVSLEPIRPDNPLLAARNCLLTPHVAWASLEARQRLMATTARNVQAFLEGSPQNVVN